MVKESVRVEVVCEECVSDKVTVYQDDRAEVTRLVAATLKPGATELVVKRLPDTLIPDSIRVDGRKGNVLISDVAVRRSDPVRQTKEDPHKDQADDRRRKDLQSRIDALRNNLTLNKALTEQTDCQLTLRKSYITKIVDNCTSRFNEDSIKDIKDDMEEALKNYGQTTYDTIVQTASLATQKAALDKDVKKLETELKEVGKDGPVFSTDKLGEVSVLLEVKGEAEEAVELAVSYQVRKASWKPSYDFRVNTDGDKPRLSLTYYGEVKQSSEEDWKEAQLFLSTAKPALGGALPEPSPIRLSLVPEPKPYIPTRTAVGMDMGGGGGASTRSAVGMDMGGGGSGTRQPVSMYMGSAAGGGGGGGQSCYMGPPGAGGGSPSSTPPPPPPPPRPKQETTRAVGGGELGGNALFEIPRRKSLPSDGVARKVTVAIVEMEPKMGWDSVPSKNPAVFLKATTTNKSEFTLMSGKGSVFLDGSFVAKTSLRAVGPGESFSVSLGVDPSVTLDRKPLERHRQVRGIMHRTRTETCLRRFVLKNSQAKDVRVVLQEPVPLSQDDKIGVQLLSPEVVEKDAEAVGEEKEGAWLDDDHVLHWAALVPARQEKVLELGYAVEAPKDADLRTTEL